MAVLFKPTDPRVYKWKEDYLRPFKLTVWIFLLASLAVMLFVFWAITSVIMNRSMLPAHQAQCMSPKEAVWFIFTVFLKQGELKSSERITFSLKQATLISKI